MKISLQNNSCLLTVDLFGGAIVDFHLKDDAQINPLSFAFTQEQMPANNKKGAPYQGHFLCLGRWGEPSQGEIKSGISNHGEAANIQWQLTENNNHLLQMQTTAKLEGLHVQRKIMLQENDAVFAVNETVQNINPLGRLYNIVQHPTLAAPFLNNDTVIDCNADQGFDQSLYKNISNNILPCPNAKDEQVNSFNLRHTSTNYNSVFSFVVKQDHAFGWITAYSPTHNLLFGYVWPRIFYPWIHLWQHFENNTIKYRGIEFGTAGIHQPFIEIINTASMLFGEKTFAYIDANERISKNYFAFLYKVKPGFTGVEEITIEGNTINIKPKNNSANIYIKLPIGLSNELSK